MEHPLPYVIPNLCAWCGSSDIIDTKDVEEQISNVLMSSGDYHVRTIKLSLPICKKCNGNLFRIKKVFIPHGVHLEFQTPTFHAEFGKLNPDLSVLISKNELVFLPQQCSKCFEKPATTLATKIAKSDLQVPVCDDCQKDKKANAGCILRGKLCFFNPIYHVEFSRLNPNFAYDLEQALIDGSFEQDFEANFGIGPGGYHRSFVKQDDEVTEKFNAIDWEINERTEFYKKLILGWLLSCGFSRENSKTLMNILFSTESDKYEIPRIKFSRRVSRMTLLGSMLTYQDTNSKSISNTHSGLVKVGADAILERAFCRTPEFFFADIAHQWFKEITEALENIRTKDVIEGQEIGRLCWAFWREAHPGAKEDLELYLSESWDYLGDTMISMIVDQVFNGKLISVIDIVRTNLLNLGYEKNPTNQKALQVYYDLKLLETQLRYLKVFKQDNFEIMPKLDFLLTREFYL